MSELLPHITLDSGPDPQFSIIWLHGLGASGEDFAPMAQGLQLPQTVRHLFPHAPERPVTLNEGIVMPAWYDITERGPGAAQDEAGIAASRQEIEKLIAREVARGIVPARIFLAGFSQGGAMALHTGLYAKENLGGILALSTYLPLSDRICAADIAAARNTPIFMAHGTQDTVVPYALGKQSAALMQQFGCTIKWYEYPMPHSVCTEEIRDIRGWLTQQMLAAEYFEKSSG